MFNDAQSGPWTVPSSTPSAANSRPPLSSAVDERRLLQRFDELAACGVTANGGLNRRCLSIADAEAHATVFRWFKKPGYDLGADRIGNTFITCAGTDTNAAPAALKEAALAFVGSAAPQRTEETDRADAGEH